MSIGKLGAAVHSRAKQAAATLTLTIGSERQAALAQNVRTAARVSKKLGVIPQHGMRPKRYWPIALIAVALAEAAHAPLQAGASTVGPNPPPLQPAANVATATEPASTNHRDMHGPFKPDQARVLNKSDSKRDLAFDLKPLVNPTPFHISPSDITPHSAIDLIHTGGGGITFLNPSGGAGGGGAGSSVIPRSDPVTFSGSVTGGGGVIGPVTGGGGSSGGAGTGAVIIPIVTDSTGSVSVPEPGCISILLIGLALLGGRNRLAIPSPDRHHSV